MHICLSPTGFDRSNKFLNVYWHYSSRYIIDNTHIVVARGKRRVEATKTALQSTATPTPLLESFQNGSYK